MMTSNIELIMTFGLLPNNHTKITFYSSETGLQETVDANTIISYERKLYIDRFRMFDITKFGSIINRIVGNICSENVLEMIAYTISGVMYRIHSGETLYTMIYNYGDIQMNIKIPETIGSIASLNDLDDVMHLTSPVIFEMKNPNSDFYIQFLFNKNREKLDAEALILNPENGVFTTTDMYLYRTSRGTTGDYRGTILSNVMGAKMYTLYINDNFDKIRSKCKNNLLNTLNSIYFVESKNMPIDNKLYMGEYLYNPLKNTYKSMGIKPISRLPVEECMYSVAAKSKHVFSMFK